MKQFTLSPIGSVEGEEGAQFIQLAPGYAPALEGLEGFSHINVLWWFDRCDTPKDRAVRGADSPYTRGPAYMGIFATRSPRRPNPIALSVVQVLGIDQRAGRVWIAYCDAAPGTPVLDLKPYTPSIDRVKEPRVPRWCGHWPKDVESAGEFDWESEFNF
ncbi:SAM-dependent methyltransferase [Allofournierella sp.]|uniref:SAM-dependent methyltransferase n=1 Tax=Allofournierella sp. TaxID=1940256 RepID=UPI003AB60947